MGCAAVATIATIVVLLLIWVFSESDEEEAQRLAKEAEDKAAGFHCLSRWDGSHPRVVEDLRAVLNDADSFEHVETRVTPVGAVGTHQLKMKYRARNAFGALMLKNASAAYRNDDCIVLWQINDLDIVE